VGIKDNVGILIELYDDVKLEVVVVFSDVGSSLSPSSSSIFNGARVQTGAGVVELDVIVEFEMMSSPSSSSSRSGAFVHEAAGVVELEVVVEFSRGPILSPSSSSSSSGAFVHAGALVERDVVELGVIVELLGINVTKAILSPSSSLSLSGARVQAGAGVVEFVIVVVVVVVYPIPRHSVTVAR
jgi:hypothetical protein